MRSRVAGRSQSGTPRRLNPQRDPRRSTVSPFNRNDRPRRPRQERNRPTMPNPQRLPQPLTQKIRLGKHPHQRMRHNLLPRPNRHHRPAQPLLLINDQLATLHRPRIQPDRVTLKSTTPSLIAALLLIRELETFQRRGVARLFRRGRYESMEGLGCHGPVFA